MTAEQGAWKLNGAACPKCGRREVVYTHEGEPGLGMHLLERCQACGAHGTDGGWVARRD